MESSNFNAKYMELSNYSALNMELSNSNAHVVNLELVVNWKTSNFNFFCNYSVKK